MTAANNAAVQTSEASTNIRSDNISKLIGLLAILAPTFYLMGDSYFSGALENAGIAKTSFPLSIQETYVQGFYGVGAILVKATSAFYQFLINLSPIGILLILSLCTLFFYLFSKFKNTQFNSTIASIIVGKFKKQWQYLHWNNNHFSRAITITAIGSYLIVLLLYILICASLLWWLLPMSSYYVGKSVNSDKLTEFRTHGCQFHQETGWSNCHILKSKDDKVIHKGYLAAQNSVRVAFLTAEGISILTIPKDAVLNRQWQAVKNTKTKNDQSTSSKAKKGE